MTVAELMTLLERVDDDNKEIVIRPYAKEPCEVNDIEEWENYAEIIPGAIIDTYCYECDGYGKLYSYKKEPNGGEPKSELITIIEQCPKCKGKGYFNLEEHFTVNHQH